MDAQLNAFLEDRSARYLAAKNEGQQVIRRRWRMLCPGDEDRAGGQRLLLARGVSGATWSGLATSLPQHDAERLEQAVGLFKPCLAAKLPFATDKGPPIPYEVFGVRKNRRCLTVRNSVHLGYMTAT